MNLVQIIIGCVLGGGALIGIIGNWSVAMRYVFWRKRGSCVPLVPGALGTAALLLLPWESAHRFWWIPLVVDVGTVPLVCALLIQRARRTSQS